MDGEGNASMNQSEMMLMASSADVIVNISGGDGKDVGRDGNSIGKGIVDSPPNIPTIKQRKPTAAPSVDQNPNPPPEKIPSMTSSGAAGGKDGVDKAKQMFGKDNLKKKMSLMKAFVECVVFLSILGGLVASLTVDHVNHLRLWSLEIWKWCLLVVVVVCGMMFTNRLMHFIVLVIEVNFLLKKKVMYYVHGLKKSVQVFIWLALVLATWLFLFNTGEFHKSSFTSKVLDYITWTIVSLLVGSFLWLLKTLLLKILAESFHGINFFDRVQESIFHQYILQTLSRSPMLTNVGMCESSSRMRFWARKKGKEGKATDVTDVNELHQMKQEKVTAWTVKMLAHSISTSGLSTFSSKIEEGAYGEQADKETICKDEATAATSDIFRNVAQSPDADHCNMYIDKSHLMSFLMEEEIAIVFPLIDVAKKGKINMEALNEWVLKVIKERKDLAQSLDDTKTAVNELNKLVIAILIIMMTVVWFLLTGIANTKVLLFLSSQLVVAAFIFGNTCKTIFEAIIFVFIMHPFDVEDRCVIDGVQLIVDEVNILSTVFLRYDNEKIYYPNSVLATKCISNFNRSPKKMGDSFEFSIDFKTPVRKIEELKENIKVYVEKNKEFWDKDHSVVVKEIEDVNKIKMALYVTHTINFQDPGVKSKRKTELVMEMKKIFEKLNIDCNLLPQQVHVKPHTE